MLYPLSYWPVIPLCLLLSWCRVSFPFHKEKYSWTSQPGDTRRLHPAVFFQFSLILMSLVIWIAGTLVRKEVFWLKLAISVYVICLLRLQSEYVPLASICQEARTVGWGIPQGGPKVWPVLLTWFILSQQLIRWWKMAFYIYLCI